MPVAEFPGRRGWGYDGVYLSPPSRPTAGPTACARWSTPRTRPGWRSSSTSSTTTSAPPGSRRWSAFGPYFTEQYETPWGQAINYDGARLRSGARVGAAERRGLGPRLRHRRPAPGRDPRDLRLERRAHRRGDRRGACTRSRDDALVIAESGLNDPRVMRARERGGYGCDAAWADDFHHALRTLLTDERDGYYADFGARRPAGQGLSPAPRPRRQLLGVPPAALRRAGRRRAARAVRGLLPEPRPGRQPRLRRPAAGRGAAAGRVLHAAVAVRAAAVHGRGVRRDRRRFSSSPTTSTSEIADATREGRRARVRRVRRSSSEEIPDPQDPATFERSKLTRERDPELAALYARAARRAPRAAAGRRRRDRVRRGRALAAGPARPIRAALQLRR